MKASHRKTTTGYYPVIIFNNKSRMTERVVCLTKDMARIMAAEIIQDLRGRYPEYMEVYDKAVD